MRKNKMGNKFKTISYLFFFSLFLLPGAFILAETEISTSSDSVSIHLDIRSATSTLYNNTIIVLPCAVTASSTLAVNAYCAVKQSGLESDWSAYGEDQFLNSISGIENDYGNNFYWSWFSNLEYGQTALSQHLLTADENLLITIGRLPLKLTAATTTPYLDDVLGLDVLAFGFDASWNGVWAGAASSSIKIGDNLHSTDSLGHYNLTIGTTTTFTVTAEADNFLPSNSITIFPLEKPVIESVATSTATTTATATEPVSEENNSGGSSNITNPKSFDVQQAFDFLLSQQKIDGSFGSSLYTDWVAIALASGGKTGGQSKLISYLKAGGDELISVTDYERHAMALMALDINPYNGTEVNYIQKIVDNFNGEQIGDLDLVNDDIFAIFPLINSGYTTHDLIIQKIIKFIIEKQKSDGSWEGGVDITAAAVQALSLVAKLDQVDQALNKAHDYLHSRQQSDGGFGSSFSTSWALQAIYSLGEELADWEKDGNSPEDYLALLQQSDGGLESVETDKNTRLWATAYALPAILAKPWSEILSTFSRPVFLSDNSVEAEPIEPVELDEEIEPIISVVTPAISASPDQIDFSSVLPFIQTQNLSKENQGREEAIIAEPGGSYLPLVAAVASDSSFNSSGVIMAALLLSGLFIIRYIYKFKKN